MHLYAFLHAVGFKAPAAKLADKEAELTRHLNWS